jgi:hypothetical protein
MAMPTAEMIGAGTMVLSQDHIGILIGAVSSNAGYGDSGGLVIDMIVGDDDRIGFADNADGATAAHRHIGIDAKVVNARRRTFKDQDILTCIVAAQLRYKLLIDTLASTRSDQGGCPALTSGALIRYRPFPKSTMLP